MSKLLAPSQGTFAPEPEVIEAFSTQGNYADGVVARIRKKIVHLIFFEERVHCGANEHHETGRWHLPIDGYEEFLLRELGRLRGGGSAH